VVELPCFVNNELKYSRKDGLYGGDGKIEAWAIELYSGQDKILTVSCYKQPQMKIQLTVRTNSSHNSKVNS
jgi:hypothetical protein